MNKTFEFNPHNEDETKYNWQREPMDERFPDPISPMFDDIYLFVLNKSVVETSRYFGLDTPKYLPRYRTVNGYIYNNFDIKKNSKINIIKYMLSFDKMAARVESEYSGHYSKVHDELADKVLAVDTASLPMEELQRHLREAENNLYQVMVYQTIIAYLITTFEKLTKSLVKIVFGGKQAQEAYQKLLLGSDENIFNLDKEFQVLVRNISDHSNLSRLFMNESPVNVLRELENNQDYQDFFEVLKEFVLKNRFFTFKYDFINTSWGEDLTIPINYLKALLLDAKKGEKSITGDASSQYDVYMKRANDIFRRSLIKRLFKKKFFRILDMSRKFMALKEERIRKRLKLFYGIKMILKEIGHRLNEKWDGFLARDDIYFLKRDELAGLCNWGDKLPLDTFSLKINHRKKIFNSQLELIDPPLIDLKHRIIDLGESDKNVFHGIGASPGQVEGVVRIVLDPDEFCAMKRNEILVTKTTNPAWNPFFGIASGIITETGGSLCHASITAREYGIPAVVSVHHASRKLKDGDNIILDGDKGTVRKI